MVHRSTWLDKVTPLWLFYFWPRFFFLILQKKMSSLMAIETLDSSLFGNHK